MTRFKKMRLKMVQDQIKKRGITNTRVLDAFKKVPREAFVPPEEQNQAYGDHPLPIGEGQTISQPYIVALMTDALDIREEDIVLEIGTGSGYQAAILGELARQVYSIERIPALGEQARKALEETGYNNVVVIIADGSSSTGLKQIDPPRQFDKIIVTAAAPTIPESLIKHLTVGGKMVIPVGSLHTQDLVLVTKKEGDPYDKLSLGGCRFVPLKGTEGF